MYVMAVFILITGCMSATDLCPQVFFDLNYSKLSVYKCGMHLTAVALSLSVTFKTL